MARRGKERQKLLRVGIGFMAVMMVAGSLKKNRAEKSISSFSTRTSKIYFLPQILDLTP
jgi:hypothetical protein